MLQAPNRPPMRLASLLCVLALAGCREALPSEPGAFTGPTFPLVYEVGPTASFGANSTDTVVFTAANGQANETSSTGLPWKLEIDAPLETERTYILEATTTALGSQAGLTARILVDGSVVAEESVQGLQGGVRTTRTIRTSYRHRP